jgi:hypothetical protein
MRWLAIPLVFTASLGFAAPRCPDAKLQRATIGGDIIAGGVVLRKKPLKFAQVRVYASAGNIVWVGATDNDGRFSVGKLPPDT